jgi:hypothetical protein
VAYVLADRIKETSTTTGTGAYALAGAVANFRAFSAKCANGDTVPYFAVDDTLGSWECGIGTWNTGNTLSRTLVVDSATGSAISWAAGTRTIFLAPLASKNMNQDATGYVFTPYLAAGTDNPSVIPPGTIAQFARDLSGRTLPAWVPEHLGSVTPTGRIQSPQPNLWSNNYLLYRPAGGTIGTGSGAGLGRAWTSGGTVTHPTPSNGNVWLTTARTRFANIVTTTNQTLGIRMNTAADQMFQLGSASNLGGFFFFCRFGIGLIPAATVRLFVGLTATATGSVVSSDTVLANTVGLWHATTDGITVLSMVQKNATTQTITAIPGVGTLAANSAFDFYMYAQPGQSSLFYRLDDINAGTTIVDSALGGTNLPVLTTFMQPQAMMSNGTANITVTTTAFELMSLYVESDW